MATEDIIPLREAPYFIKDGRPVVERARFDALMTRVRQHAREAQST